MALLIVLKTDSVHVLNWLPTVHREYKLTLWIICLRIELCLVERHIDTLWKTIHKSACHVTVLLPLTSHKCLDKSELVCLVFFDVSYSLQSRLKFRKNDLDICRDIRAISLTV